MNAISRRIGVVIIAGAIVIAAGGVARADTPTPSDPAPPARLLDLKARADAAVQERLAQIDTLGAKVNDAGADCGENVELSAQLAADRSGLQALDATIQAETDPAQARIEFRQIFTDFRIFWLQTPKTNEVVGCDRTVKATSAITDLAQRIQTRVDEAKAHGLDVAAAQAALDDLATQVSVATTAANHAASSVIGLQPDKGDPGVLASNRAALDAGRQDLHTALAAIQSARHDARAAIDALKAIHSPGAPTSSSTTAAA